MLALSIEAHVDQEIVDYLLRQRKRMRTRLARLRSGQSWTSEMHAGEPIDTTAQTLSVLEDNLEEIERLLTKVGAPLDA